MISSVPVVIAVLLQLPSPPPTKNSSVNQKTTNSETRQAANQAASTPMLTGPEAYHYQYNAYYGANGGTHVPEWITAFATVVYAWAAFYTLRAIRRQGDIMVASERAWVMVDKFGEPPLTDGDIERPEWLAFFAGTPQAVVHFKVFGRTPARITDVYVRFHPAPRRIGPSQLEPDLPEEPVFPQTSGISRTAEHGFVKAPEQDFAIPVLLEDGYLLPDQVTQIKQDALFLCAYGSVKYEAMSKLICETRFCYIYRVSHRTAIHSVTGENIYPSKFLMGGPQAYNRCT